MCEQDFWAAGTAVLGNLVITVTAIIGLHTRSWHFSHVFVDVGSVVFWFVFLFVYHSLTPGQLGGLDSDDNVYDIVWDLGSSALYHLTTLLVVVMCCAPVMCYMMVKENYFPQIDDYYRRVVHSPGVCVCVCVCVCVSVCACTRGVYNAHTHTHARSIPWGISGGG